MLELVPDLDLSEKMLFWDHNTNNLRDWSHNMIFGTLGTVPEPHFIDAGIGPRPCALIGNSYFNLEFLANEGKRKGLAFGRYFDWSEFIKGLKIKFRKINLRLSMNKLCHS